MSLLLEENCHLSHRAKRKLRKKLARQLVRRHNAQIRDQSSAKDIVAEEEAARIEAEEEIERQRHDEEERKWIERERIAQEIFAQKKALEEVEQKSKQDIQKNALAKEIVVQPPSLQIFLNLPPNHCPEPPHINWKRDELCQFFLKTGACRYGDRCSRHHLTPPLHPSDIASLGLSNSKTPRLILIIENMFNHFSFQCDPLECDETQLLIDYHDFYADVRPVLENVCGGPLEIFRCCRNALPHLRGNVYIQLTQDPTIASDVAIRLSSQRYDGKQLVTRLAYLCEGWESAICGCHLRGNCPRGDMNCNYLHIFLNPNEKTSDVLTHLSSHRASEKPSRESRSGRSRRNSERHPRAHRRDSMNQSHSRERHRHKSHRRKSLNRIASVNESPSKNRSRSKERSRHCKSKHRRSGSRPRASSNHRFRSP
nr:U2 small nuclear ribonucleoprotein auxiliary [Hymenolepis microstoma]